MVLGFTGAFCFTQAGNTDFETYFTRAPQPFEGVGVVVANWLFLFLSFRFPLLPRGEEDVIERLGVRIGVIA